LPESAYRYFKPQPGVACRVDPGRRILLYFPRLSASRVTAYCTYLGLLGVAITEP